MMITDEAKRTVKFRGKYRVESARLKNWDYSSEGAYFITICTRNREHSFGEIMNGVLTDTRQSRICAECWFDLPNHYSNCVLDAFVIMPNHVHGVIMIDNRMGCVKTRVDTDAEVRVETGLKPVSTNDGNKRHSLFEIVRGFKTFTARKINDF